MPAAGSLPVDSAEDAEALHLKLVRCRVVPLPHVGLLDIDVGQRALAWASGYFFLLALGLTGFLMLLSLDLSGSSVPWSVTGMSLQD